MDGKRCNEEMRLISLASHCSTVLAVLTMIDTSCHVLNHGPKYVMYYVSVSVDLPEDEVSLTNRAAQSSPQSEPAHVASTEVRALRCAWGLHRVRAWAAVPCSLRHRLSASGGYSTLTVQQPQKLSQKLSVVHHVMHAMYRYCEQYC